jgi:hypothetical protein
LLLLKVAAIPERPMNRIVLIFRSLILTAAVLVFLLTDAGFPQGAKDSAPVSGFLHDVAIITRPQGVKVELTGEGLPADFRPFPLSQPPRLVFDFPGVLSSFPKKFLKVDHSLLKDVRLGQHPDKLRLVLAFPTAELPAYRLIREAGRVTILLGKFEEDSGAEKKPAPEERRETSSPQGVPPRKAPPAKPPSPAAVSPAKVLERKPTPLMEKTQAEKSSVRIYSGEKISLDFIDADIRRVLALISEASQRQIVPSPEVQGTITLRLIDVPWDQALDAILSIYNLKKVEEGNLIRVLPREKS